MPQSKLLDIVPESQYVAEVIQETLIVHDNHAKMWDIEQQGLRFSKSAFLIMSEVAKNAYRSINPQLKKNGANLYIALLKSEQDQMTPKKFQMFCAMAENCLAITGQDRKIVKPDFAAAEALTLNPKPEEMNQVLNKVVITLLTGNRIGLDRYAVSTLEALRLG